MNNSNLKQANNYFRSRKYREAMRLYSQILDGDLPNKIKSHVAINLEMARKRLGKVNISEQAFYPDNIMVDDALTALDDADFSFNNITLKPGLTALIRAKNAQRFIELSITSILDIVDEIIVVDNNSTDNTLNILNRFSESYEKVRVYSYCIEIPKVGTMHENAIKEGDPNTLGTFYNWCLSKVRTTNVLKWDADFVALRNNLVEMVDLYDLHNTDENVAIWCTGVTSYYGKTIRLSSWYDEFRIFSRAYGAKWENYKGCETITPSIYNAKKCVIFGFKEDTRSLDEKILKQQKEFSKPVFIEIKDSINIKSESMIIDQRDRDDNFLIKKYINNHPYYKRPNLFNSYKVLITIPNLVLGGGNYWAKLLYEQISYMGVHVDIGINDFSNEIEIMSGNVTTGFYGIPIANLLFLSPENKSKIGSYTHFIFSCPFAFEDEIKVQSKAYMFTHSDVSYINNHALKSNFTPVALNDVTIEKFGERNKLCMLLHNCLPSSIRVNSKKFDSNYVKILYCNRISFDKNVPMLLLALKKLVLNYKFKGQLTLLAGGAEYSKIEYQTIVAAIKVLELEDFVDLLPSQKDVESFYLSHDFCVLASVSEGCSYGLLESINYEVPIVTTNNSANVEVTKKMLPCFDLEGIKNRAQSVFCIDNYNGFLDDIGYVDTSRIHDDLNISHAFYEKYQNYIVSLTSDSEFRQPDFYTPFIKIKLDEIDKKIYSSFLIYWDEQEKKFENGAASMSVMLNNMIQNFDAYKGNTIKLKQENFNKYYSPENNRKMISRILFSDDFIFE